MDKREQVVFGEGVCYFVLGEMRGVSEFRSDSVLFVEREDAFVSV